MNAQLITGFFAKPWNRWHDPKHCL